MQEREYRAYHILERVTHYSPILMEGGALTWYGLEHIIGHESKPFNWLSKLENVYGHELVGQEDKIKALADHIASSPSGSVATVLGPFGSGKTGFVFGLAEELISSGKMRREEIKHRAMNDLDWNKTYTVDDILRDNFPGEKDRKCVHPRLLILEEHERADKQTDEDAFTMLGLLLPEIPFLILTGESTLKDPQFFKLIGVDRSKIYSVEMDPITPESLKEALKRRMIFIFGDYAQGFDPDALFDPEFLDFLIPNTNPPVATYRDALLWISSMGQQAETILDLKGEQENQPAHINGDFYRKIRQARRSTMEPYEYSVKAGLHKLIRTTYDHSTSFQPLSYEKLIELGLYEGMGLDRTQRGRERELDRRMRSLLSEGNGAIVEVDKSELTKKKDSDRRFLPTVDTFLDARYNPILE